MDNWLLMYMDKPVLSFDKGLERVTVLDAKYLPYGLKESQTGVRLYRWIANRATPLTRKNVEFLYMLLGQPRSVGGQQRLVQEFGGVSVNDCFWIKRTDEETNWIEISPFGNGLPWSNNDRAFGYGILTGEVSDALKPNRFSPETTLQGNWSKCLARSNSGVLLYKANDRDKREVEVAEWGRSLGLDVVHYWTEDYEDVECTVCRVECNEDNQWISAEEVGEEQAAKRFPDEYRQMRTFDFIVGNPDRHTQNWGWLVDGELKPKGMTPLYDFNFAIQGVNMAQPEQVDWELVEKAKRWLTEKPDTPNAGYYRQRIAELEKGKAQDERKL